MEELNALIQHVAEKSKLLKADLAEKNNLVTQLQEDISRLRSKNAEFEKQIEGLKSELSQTKMVPHSNQQQLHLNERIDELVREIDDCMYHLKQ